MLYYLALYLIPHISAFNVFTYNTVRAGAAALTAFLFSLLVGPVLIRKLRALKIGQYIRQDHVADLHALHKTKAGTPTMGGALILLATIFALVLWARPINRLIWVAALIFIVLGAVGFIDDFAKLRKKRNLGLSAKAKFACQLVIGFLLGLYLVFDPITVGGRIYMDDVRDWPRFVGSLKSVDPNDPGAALWRHIEPPVRARLIQEISNGVPELFAKRDILAEINNVITDADLAADYDWNDGAPSAEAAALEEKRSRNGGLESLEQTRLNRLILEQWFSNAIAQSPTNLHTHVEVPVLKNVLIPLGLFYAFFVMITIVAASNAVNLTDGLDGLAIGASIISLLAFTGISYVVSRADWTEYLYLVPVPEASELTVFGAALLGAGLGFLWFNSHPAEVFMGDTGSLALGGAIGTMAILTKQELLLIVVGGLFVMEAGSVVLQVLSFKLRKKRVFKMAPLHHHFELLGWSESKVTIRFWILAICFALMSLATLKLR